MKKNLGIVALSLLAGGLGAFATETRECDRCTPFLPSDAKLASCPRPVPGPVDSGFAVSMGSWFACLSEHEADARRQGANDEMWHKVAACKSSEN